MTDSTQQAPAKPERPDYYCTEHGKQLRWNGCGWECVRCEEAAELDAKA